MGRGKDGIFKMGQIIELAVRSVTSVKLCREKWQAGIHLDVITEGSCISGWWISAILKMSCISQENRFHYLSFFRFV